MSILSNIYRCVRHIKTEEGYRKISEWQLAKDVECADGQTVEEKLNGLTQNITEIKVVSALPSDASSHTTTLYIVR